jgi:5,10-methylenetetrahydromethanopterin reductase
MSVELWRMGATPVPATEIGCFARQFEEWGWDGLAIGEAHGLLPDPYVLLALAAAATTTLKVGTAVAVPLRAPLLAAGAMATLQALSGGRASFSMGRGDGAMKVLRRGPLRVAEFDDYVRSVQGYLRREEVDLDGVITSMSRIDDFDPSLALPPPSLNIAATGPRTIEVAARWADGVSFSVGADLERLRNAIGLAHDACRKARRDPESLTLGCYVQVAVTDEADTSAREAIRGLVVTHARFSGFEARPVGDVDSAAHERYRHAVETMEAVYRDTRGGIAVTEGGRPGEIDFYPRAAGADELIDAFAIAGPADYCAGRLREIAGLGIERIYIGTRAVGVDLEERNAERIGREVLPGVPR